MPFPAAPTAVGEATMRNLPITLLAACAGALGAAPPAAAQGAAASGPAPANRSSASTASKPAAGAESRPSLSPHARVRVSLKNGQRITGIVKNNRMSERAEGFDFFLARPDDEKAGLRLWYANAGQSYVFIGHKEIGSVISLGLVSELEIRELEAKAVEEARQIREREASERLATLRDRVRARDAEHESEQKLEADRVRAEEERAKKAELEKAKRLVERFPPDDGWGEEKQKAILAKKANHLYPSAEELEFLKLFETWKAAVELTKQSEAGPVEGEAPEKPEKPEKNEKNEKNEKDDKPRPKPDGE